ncbi:TetR family transcriptional regulator [Streptomyces sp. MJP52]|uniref:TetR/AcrR family transcriptional regulator n=1 Tax=Streptomyces sp. MJP52 TaxID=2940555 RepID=UPI00247334F0|nr:TetR family transcriptional regulator [Streptomyces sp. MJP52]MDH6228526.1 AcrR family transcriptional regulator [Streptomyces sp. MJP52]
MPRRVDHEERRTEITEALLRVAHRRGLHAVGMRDVAAEAGVSLRLVQYYFDSKEKLLLHGLRTLVERFSARTAARLAAVPGSPGPRETVEALLMAALPADEESRVFHHVYTSYAVLAMSDEALAGQPFTGDPDAAEDAVAGLLARGQADGTVSAEVDARLEAVSLLAMSAGLGTGVLVGQRDVPSAVAAIRYRLDRVFTGRAG